MQKLITIAELAEYLGVSQATIHRWIKEGVLPPPKRIGPPPAGSVRWIETEVTKWISSLPSSSESDMRKE